MNIEHKEVEELAKDLAEELGTTEVNVVVKALSLLREELHAEKSARIDQRRRGLLAWLEELQRNPLPPSKAHATIEADLYDEDGLPK